MNIHPAAARRSKAHTRYYHPVTGKQVPGASTIAKKLAVNLETWANNLGLEGIKYREYLQSLADIGTILHERIWCYFNKQTPDLDDFPKRLIDASDICYAKFESWLKQHEVVPIWTEEARVSAKYAVGGTIDFYGLVDGIYTLADYKTSNRDRPVHWRQVAGYIRIAEEHLPEAEHPAQAIVLCMSREADDTVLAPVKTDLSKEWAVFEHLLAIDQIEKGKK